jgi:hypothetical protein
MNKSYMSQQKKIPKKSVLLEYEAFVVTCWFGTGTFITVFFLAGIGRGILAGSPYFILYFLEDSKWRNFSKNSHKIPIKFQFSHPFN